MASFLCKIAIYFKIDLQKGGKMVTIDKNKPVMVSGGTGYLASWIVKMLLDNDINVHTTVRDFNDEVKLGHFESLKKKSNADLKLFEANLLVPGDFDEPMKGCELVIHTASPHILTGIKNSEEELIRPALEGTKNILESANKNSTVKRIVLTSSIVAIYGDTADIQSISDGVFTEKDWNVTSTSDHQPYSYSKTVAEKEAWFIAEQQDQWDLLTINPGWILGPSVSKRTDSMSIRTMIEFGNGTYKSGVPQLWTPIVDVRDVATAHIKAGFTPKASGRHIVVSEEATLLDIAKILRKHFGEEYPFPSREAPKYLFWLIAPMYGRTRKYVSRNVGFRIKLDNSYSKSDLNMSFLPIEQTIKEHFQQILDDGMLAKL